MYYANQGLNGCSSRIVDKVGDTLKVSPTFTLENEHFIVKAHLFELQ